MQILFLVGRVIFGGYFIMSGFKHFMSFGMMKGYAASKGVPAPGLAIAFTGLLLVFGGAGVLAGVYIQWAILALVIFLVPVSFQMHAFWKIPDPMMKMNEMVNFTKNMALFGAVLMLLAIPTPWPFAFF